MGFWPPSLPIRRKTETRTETASGQLAALWLSDLTVRRSYGKCTLYFKQEGDKTREARTRGCGDPATQSCSLAPPIRHTLERSFLSWPARSFPSSPVCFARRQEIQSQRGDCPTDAAPTSYLLAASPSPARLPCPALPCPALLGLTSSWLRRSNFPDVPKRCRGYQKSVQATFHPRQN